MSYYRRYPRKTLHDKKSGGAEFTLNGKTYHLTKNQGENNLHSGPDFFHKRLWKTLEEDDSHVVFALESPDGDQGYPGTMDIRVTYSLNDDPDGLYKLP